ncbi:MAG: zinc-finger domain-containing protein [Proteobacteria bacterium]|nr:zinc-finger domain-containing protein [Pseudomonadota bacterium]
MQSEPEAQAIETIEVETPTVACDGGGGALGHPRVYLRIGPEGRIVCPYCSRTFALKDGAGATAGH